MIRKIGNYMETDAEGFLIPGVAWEKIPVHWLPLIEDITEYTKKDTNILSLYLRGSVPRGLAVDYISDLDLMFIAQNCERKLSPSVIEFRKDLSKRYPFCNGIEWSIEDAETCEKIKGKRGLYLSRLLKTQGLHVYGRDFTKDYPKVKPGKDMLSHAPGFEGDWMEFKEEIVTAKSQKEIDGLKLWIGKRILRTAFEIVTLDKPLFTRDLYLCYESAAKEYPEIDTPLYKVLELLLGQKNVPDDILAVFQPVAEFLIEKIRQHPALP